jgi:hyperosmotically inducible periplasmic protein
MVLLLAAAFTAPAFQTVSDDTIHDQVRRILANDRDIRGGTLNVEVDQGVVTLRGVVEIEKYRQKAERLTKRVKGVKQIKNDLQVARKDVK